ncbi:MAG TPA: hypothetical protein VMT89_18440, partial [Candidatus Acidoferrales bacterium]|nr:hypothetical protein [Candidatus Acidoferrales bacterium]
YGLGEALIDTQFRDAPGYPRSLRFYAGRLASQVGAMVRAVASGGKRGWLHWRGMATAYEAVVPWLWLLIEASNVAGKVQGVWLTRGLRYAEPLRRFFAHRVRREYKPERRR